MFGLVIYQDNTQYKKECIWCTN